jgi:hypothetical protein
MKPSNVAGLLTRLVAGLLLALSLAVSLLVVACNGRATPPTLPPPVEGPALVMFYSDN